MIDLTPETVRKLLDEANGPAGDAKDRACEHLTHIGIELAEALLDAWAERDRLREDADVYEWVWRLAAEYGDAGGSGGPERRELDQARDIIAAAKKDE